MWSETKGELEGSGEGFAGTPGTPSTDDPNATIPDLGPGIREPRAAGGPAASLGNGMGAAKSAVERYQILGPLGRGGMGVVYLAEDTRLGRKVAIKTVPAALATNRQAKERFLNEARTASALDHPNICTVYEIEETREGQLYLTMPCYDGETLRSRLERGTLPVAEAVHVALQAARGLAKAHQLGIVHCDVKPANLMLVGDGLVKILDFGIARLAGKASHPQAGPSGTPGYRSPEQDRGGKVDTASDVWSLGIVLYEMVAGEAPGRGERGEAVLRELPGTPPELARILARMLAFDPAGRYPHAAALLADLQSLDEHLRELATRQRVDGWRRKVKAVSLGIVAACAYRLTQARPVDPVAYDLYVQGQFHWNKRTAEELRKAAEYFERAIARDPAYAAAHAGLADTYALRAFLSHDEPGPSIAKARAEALRALSIDGNLAEAHASLGIIKLYYDWDSVGAERELRRAIELNPSDAAAHVWLFLLLVSVGRLDEAEPYLQTARRLNPFSPSISSCLAGGLLMRGDLDGAIEQSRRTIDLEPGYPTGYADLWVALDAKGRNADAFQAYERLLASAGHPAAAALARNVFRNSGYRAALLAAGDALSLEPGPKDDWLIAGTFTLAGEYDEALLRLEKGMELRSSVMVLLQQEAVWRALRGRPRFQQLLDRLDRQRARIPSHAPRKR